MKHALGCIVLLCGLCLLAFASTPKPTLVESEMSILNQTAALPPTTLFRTLEAGYYRATVYLEVSNSNPNGCDVSSINMQWTDSNGLEQLEGHPVSSALGSGFHSYGFIVPLYSVSSVPIVLAIPDNCGSVPTEPYNVRAVIEKL